MAASSSCFMDLTSRAKTGLHTVCFKGIVSSARRHVITSCLGTTGTSQVILTATRPSDNSGSVARIVGPGCELPGFGRILGFDEFFGRVNRQGLPLLDDSIFQETLIYYLGGMNKSDTKPVHGVQLYFKSKLKKRAGIIIHTREESDIEETFAKGSKRDDGAKVRVLTGRFGDISIPTPLDDFMTLDVSMRPDNDAVFPINESYGIVVYILEGAALLKHNRFANEEETVSYQNEGHGLWIPPVAASKSKTTLTVTTHPCSHLRFIVVAAKP